MPATLLAAYVACLAEHAAATEPPAVALSGFGDVQIVYDRGAEDEVDFSLGQVEVDMNATFVERLYASVAIAYDSELDHFDLGAFTLDFHLLGTDGPHFRHGGPIDHSGIIVGKFDVPFGIDWEVLPSIDRHLISTPLPVDSTHASWNDVGIQAYAETGWFNAVAYATNGWDYDATRLVLTAGAADTLEPVWVVAENAVGGRLGLKPGGSLEIGGSFAYIAGLRDDTFMSLAGLDLQFTDGPFAFRGEFIRHQIGLGARGDRENFGLYIQGLLDFGRYFLVGRLEHFALDAATAPSTDILADPARLCSGIGWRVLEGCELRAEYQSYTEDAPDRALLQLVVGY